MSTDAAAGVVETYGNPDLPEGTEERPLVTFALFAYNQEKYIREAVEGAFAQTYSPLEIILSDDCSSDRTFEIMREMAQEYEGEHRVVVRRNGGNLGVAKHFDRLMRQANGSLVVVAAGDDISLPRRTDICVTSFVDHDNVGVIEVKCHNFTNQPRIPNNSFGQPDHTLEKPKTFSLLDVLNGDITGLCGAGRAYARDTYRKFSSIASECPEEDTPALFRCLYGSSGLYIQEKLVSRRIHANNLSSPKSLSQADTSSLYRQYELDLDEALLIPLINESQYSNMAKRFERYIFRKQCAIDIYHGFRRNISMYDLVASRFLSLREKFYLLRRTLASRVLPRG